MTNKPISRKANIVVRDLDSEVLIYDQTINKAYCLNQTAGLVYQLCDGRRTVAEISEMMSKEMKTKVSEDLVWFAIDGLKKDNLLENAKELSDHFGGLTRREVVKRVGLASMIALPVISSLVAPAAINAQSCVNPGGFPPGTPVNATGTAVTCAQNLRSQCCSGQTSGGFLNCIPNPCTCGSICA
ncbi:MAG: PqqD family protein [Pyrinomonadaceae bacterium]